MRTLCSFCVFATLVCVTSPAASVEPAQWEITLSIRVVPEGTGPITLRVAVPPNDANQRITVARVSPRGLESINNDQDEDPHLLLRGRLQGPRRVSVTYHITTLAEHAKVPLIGPTTRPGPELLRYLRPSPLFQSRSLLIREFLENEVAPRLADGTTGVMRPILAATRREFEHQRDGASLVLDVVRSGRGKRIGIERTFTTFLRCAGIPARMVEGINLESATRRKRVFWNEVWLQGRWWPVSSSQGWIGGLPAHYVAVARDGKRVLQVDGPTHATYTVQSYPIVTSE